MSDKKILIFGLDCASPQLIFERWTSKLPNLSSLMQKGIYGPLKSCIPPVTVPAWSCMMTGKNPGKLGCYGFRNRSDYSYNGLALASSCSIQSDRIWDILSKTNKKVLLVGIPQTYPPSPVNGHMITGFLTPDTSCQYTYPKELANEIQSQIGEYMIDIDNFRTDEKDFLIKRIYKMTEKRFCTFNYLLNMKPWDFAMMVEMGPDRISHAFWKFMDPLHPKYEPGTPYENTILEYYKFVDKKIGETLKQIDNKTIVFVVSDHGAQAMRGGFCINEWLIQENYLSIAEPAEGRIPFNQAKIDWSKTIAWGEGGYFARVFLNVQGREPQGCISPENYKRIRNELIQKLEATKDESGHFIGTRVFNPEDVYPEINGIPPDLIVYFGNLAWRSIGSIGLNTIHTFENDLGPDDANHSEDGILILFDPQQSCKESNGLKKGLSIFDIAPTVIAMLGNAVPNDMEGKVIQAGY